MSFEEELTKKRGPLPTYAWVAIGGLVGWFFFFRKSSGGASSICPGSQIQCPDGSCANSAADCPSGNVIGFSGGAGGGGDTGGGNPPPPGPPPDTNCGQATNAPAGTQGFLAKWLALPLVSGPAGGPPLKVRNWTPDALAAWNALTPAQRTAFAKWQADTSCTGGWWSIHANNWADGQAAWQAFLKWSEGQQTAQGGAHTKMGQTASALSGAGV